MSNLPVSSSSTAPMRDNIRCLSYGVLRKLAGLPQDLFANYWRNALKPLCARLPGISYYFHRTTGRISGLCQTAFTA